MFRLQSIALLIGLMAGAGLAMAQAPATRPTPPTRDPHTPGYVTASELPDGSNPAGECGRKLYHRAHSQPRARDVCARRRAARNGV